MKKPASELTLEEATARVHQTRDYLKKSGVWTRAAREGVTEEDLECSRKLALRHSKKFSKSQRGKVE